MKFTQMSELKCKTAAHSGGNFFWRVNLECKGLRRGFSGENDESKGLRRIGRCGEVLLSGRKESLQALTRECRLEEMKLWSRGVQGEGGQSSSVERNGCFESDFFMAHSFFFLPLKKLGRTQYGRSVLNGDEWKSDGGLLFNHAFSKAS